MLFYRENTFLHSLRTLYMLFVERRVFKDRKAFKDRRALTRPYFAHLFSFFCGSLWGENL